MNDPADVCSYPQLAARGFFREVEGPDGEPMTTLGPWVKSSRSPLALRRAPRLGEHTEEVLREIGLSAAEVAELRAAGAAR